MGKKLTTEQFVNYAKTIHGDKYNYSLVEYVNAHTKIEIICKDHGIFEQKPNHHLNGSGCRKCGIEARVSEARYSVEEFISKALEAHDGKYDYNLVSAYKNSRTKVKIICLKCNQTFEQTPDSHLRGHGCENCLLHKRKDKTTFVTQAIEVHGNDYDYTDSVYVSNKRKIQIFCNGCKTHFHQIPKEHLRGYGCLPCSWKKNADARRKTTEEFVSELVKVHGDRYDYSLVEYVNSSTKITIKCCKCNKNFNQGPYSHLGGQGCPKCSRAPISKIEMLWLDFIGIPEEFRHKTIKIGKKNYHVDAFIPETNTIYEFFGDFWHGNPDVFDQNKMNIISKKSFGELYSKTQERLLVLYENKYNVNHIWEKDFKIQLKEQGK